jgi:hypothetical protein
MMPARAPEGDTQIEKKETKKKDRYRKHKDAQQRAEG